MVRFKVMHFKCNRILKIQEKKFISENKSKMKYEN